MNWMNKETETRPQSQINVTAIQGRRSFRIVGVGACVLAMLVTTVAPSVGADEGIYRYVDADGTIHMTNVPSGQQFTPKTSRHRYHASVSDHELEAAVARYAREYRLSPALLMAVMKAESGFNPIVISKAGAVGLMQLIPETAIRHGVRNLYDTEDNIAGGARHLRYLLDRFHGNIRLALAAYNAGEQKVDRYRQIPPFKETRGYVKKVMGFYRDYRTSQSIGFMSSVGSEGPLTLVP